MRRPFHESDLVGQSMPMRRLRELISTIAPTRLPVLIEGETGSGKELVAALVHQRSRRRGTLVAFNVCALGESVFEDALFGHVRGAYTGAIADSLGLLREANEGTAFFDEVSGLPVGLQAKLLRAIETGEFRPIGARGDVHSDFRIVAATNESLDDLVGRGRFRADLRHRLSGITVRVPSLAERVDDIPELVRHFARQAAGGDGAVEGAAIDLLMGRAWPGNVRELRQVVEVASAFGSASITSAAMRAALSQRAIRNAVLAGDRLEREVLLDALANAAWDVDSAADSLGIHRATIYRRMKRLSVEVPRVAPSRATVRLGSATTATSLNSQNC